MNARQEMPQRDGRTKSTVFGLCLGLLAAMVATPAVNAQKASGLISAWGRTCKMRVVEQFKIPISDAQVTIGTTEQQSLDEGKTSLSDIKTYGMSYNWQIGARRSMPTAM